MKKEIFLKEKIKYLKEFQGLNDNSKKKLMEKIILINNEEKDAKILHRKKSGGDFKKKLYCLRPMLCLSNIRIFLSTDSIANQFFLEFQESRL